MSSAVLQHLGGGQPEPLRGSPVAERVAAGQILGVDPRRQAVEDLLVRPIRAVGCDGRDQAQSPGLHDRGSDVGHAQFPVRRRRVLVDGVRRDAELGRHALDRRAARAELEHLELPRREGRMLSIV